MSPRATFSNFAASIVLTTALPESPFSATLVNVLSPVLFTNTNALTFPALPPGAGVAVVVSPELQAARLISASPNAPVVILEIELLLFLVSMERSFLVNLRFQRFY